MNFAFPMDHKVKIKENEKWDKYLDLVREQKKKKKIPAKNKQTKKPWNIKVLSSWCPTIQTTALLRSARILRRVLETWGNLSLKLQEKPSTDAGGKNPQLCGDRDETINHIISECSKLAQKKYKTRHDWEDKVIYWELYRLTTE